MFTTILQSIFLILFAVFAQSSLSDPESENVDYSLCSAVKNYRCGNQSNEIYYPFRLDTSPSYCGYPGFVVSCSGDHTTLLTNIPGKDLVVRAIDYKNHLLHVIERDFLDQTCVSKFTNTSFEPKIFNYSNKDAILTIFTDCSADPSSLFGNIFSSITCPSGDSSPQSFYNLSAVDIPSYNIWQYCSSMAVVPIYQNGTGDLMKKLAVDFMGALKQGFELVWKLQDTWCSKCMQSNGICYVNKTLEPGCCCSSGYTSSNDFACVHEKGTHTRAIIGAVTGGGGVLFLGIFVLFLYIRRKKKLRANSSNLLSQTTSKLSFKRDPEAGESSYNTHIFSYDELDEATDGFNASRELGDGGFGTVYKGFLRDGRTVAVKRLYENNYRRLEQFKNEVEILSSLRHPNLVSLYGCTSRHSRELLLVYEYIPNGTLADHLHGPLASKSPLSWPVRMSIAIQTAGALAYLHAVEPQIIHRDVKSNNILLDNNFHVKVADFGLSRLFPLDATHVSTAPQGTPGYVDPEYHQCFQLTDKSDVYSFGVVLVELISSKPAVDISRHRHEINLANMAITKIQNCQICQLVDPELGYDSDLEITQMINQVAELAFRCLQSDGEMRPCIKEALGVLKNINGETDTESNDVLVKEESRLLKNVGPFSPDSVTGRWSSRLTTPNTSG